MAREAAKRPEARTVEVAVSGGDFDGWAGTFRADFPAEVLYDLQSGNVERTIAAMAAIVVDHNFPDSDGEIANSLTDVDPYEGLIRVAFELIDTLANLPNRYARP